MRGGKMSDRGCLIFAVALNFGIAAFNITGAILRGWSALGVKMIPINIGFGIFLWVMWSIRWRHDYEA